MTDHNMTRQSANGHGSWDQCTRCGATYYSKFWHWGGFESNQEPSCSPDTFWKNQATVMKIPGG